MDEDENEVEGEGDAFDAEGDVVKLAVDISREAQEQSVLEDPDFVKQEKKHRFRAQSMLDRLVCLPQQVKSLRTHD